MSKLTAQERREVGQRLKLGRQQAREKRRAEQPEQQVAVVPTIPTETDWNTMPLEQAKTVLGLLREGFETGAKIYNQRLSDEGEKLYCLQCEQELPKRHDPRQGEVYAWAQVVPRYDPGTGTWHNTYLCSQACYLSAAREGKLRGSRT